MIFILTGPVGSGKTTSLTEWTAGRDDTGGILMPVRRGKRFFLSIGDREEYPAEAEAGDSDVIPVGPFRFSAAAFRRAQREIRVASDKHKILIIDEIGPLELDGKGFCSSLKQILENSDKLRNMHLILVVREGMVEQVADFFNIKKYSSVFSPDGIRELQNEI